MSSITLRKKFGFEFIFKSNIFIVLRIDPFYEYADGKKTDRLEGYKYEVVDTANFDRLKVKVKGQSTPLMSDEQLQELRESGRKVLVEFINGAVMPYWSPTTKSVEDAFSAEGIRLLDTDEQI